MMSMPLSEDKKKISNAIIEKINLCNIELFAVIKDKLNEIREIYPLVEFVISRLSTVTDLAINEQMWDAEIIYRAALEGAIKLVFITTADEQEKNIRIREYWTDLSEINSIKISEQAKKSIKARGMADPSILIFKPLVLDESQEAVLRSKWPRPKRHQLEQKWSFSEMIASISSGQEGQTFDGIVGLLHSYRMASHISHADETGVSIIMEREQRTADEKEIVKMAHFTRLLVDPFYLCLMLGLQICQFAKVNPTFFVNLSKFDDSTNELISKYLTLLKEDKVYDRYR